MYLMNSTDHILHLQLVSRFTHNPNQKHWKEFDKGLGYLKGTMKCGLYFPNLNYYSGVDWVSSKIDSSFTKGCLFTLGGLVA